MSWKTSLFAFLAALPQFLAASGVHIPGHVGSVTVVQAISSIGLLGLGWFAKDHNVTGGTEVNLNGGSADFPNPSVPVPTSPVVK
jgi:hypothetical protein